MYYCPTHKDKGFQIILNHEHRGYCIYCFNDTLHKQIQVCPNCSNKHKVCVICDQELDKILNSKK